MRGIHARRPGPALIVASLALFVALCGAGYAAVILPSNSVGTRQLRNGAVKSAKIANGAVGAAKVNVAQFPTVPSATHAGSATHADSATRADSAAHADSATSADNAAKLGGRDASSYVLARTVQPTSAFLQNGWVAQSTFGVPGYAKDQSGIVHLFGEMSNASITASPLFVLPPGFRPGYIVDEPAVFKEIPASLGVIRISPDGTVEPEAGTNTVDLEGISFAAGG